MGPIRLGSEKVWVRFVLGPKRFGSEWSQKFWVRNVLGPSCLTFLLRPFLLVMFKRIRSASGQGNLCCYANSKVAEQPEQLYKLINTFIVPHCDIIILLDSNLNI